MPEKLKYAVRRIFSFTAFALLFAAASFAQVRTDYDRGTNFNCYKTYSWEMIDTQNPLWVDRIEAAVDSALAAKGWTQDESGGDIAIVALEVTKDHRTLNTYYDSFGGGWLWEGGFGEATTTEDRFRVGTLVVDLFDANTKKLIWRGSFLDVLPTTDALSDQSDKNTKSLDKGVEKMFDRFPPDPRKARL